jgi:hypothetical protein
LTAEIICHTSLAGLCAIEPCHHQVEISLI